MKAIHILNWAFVVFFLLMSFAGFYQAFSMYFKYGYSYIVVTTIGNEVTAQEVTLQMNLLIAGFFLASAGLLLLNILLLKQAETAVKPY